MAKLQSDDLTLEIKFNSFEDEWVGYEIKFYWKGEIIINDSILKRTGEWWGKRNYGTFMANDFEKDHLIETIRKVLETNKPEYWEPIEPDVKIAIYPEMFFPFLKSHWTLIDETNGEIKQSDEEKQEESKHPNDLITIIIFIDSYNFKDSNSYSAEGISLHLIAERQDLEKFVTDLEMEYSKLITTVSEGSTVPESTDPSEKEN